MMSGEGVFPRLLDLIQGKADDDVGLHRMLLELLYDMSRIQRIRLEDLSNRVKCRNLEAKLTGETVLIEEEFLAYMFRMIEELSDDVNDPYHYPIIRVLVGHLSGEEQSTVG